MPEISVEQLLGQLREFVELLAAPAATQEAWLKKGRWPVDELAMQLDDAVPAWFPRLTEAGLLSAKAQQVLVVLLAALDDFSGRQNAALWTKDALYDAPQWQGVRDLAGRALAAMDDAVQ